MSRTKRPKPPDTSRTNKDELELMAITDQFVASYTAGEWPRLSDYLAHYPQHAEALTDFVTAFLSDQMSESAANVPERMQGQLSPGMLRGLDLIAQQTGERPAVRRVAEAPASYGAKSKRKDLLTVAHERGVTDEELAAATDLSPEVLRLMATRPLTLTDLPSVLVGRLGAALKLPSARVLELLPATGSSASRESLRALLTGHPSLGEDQRQRWRHILGA